MNKPLTPLTIRKQQLIVNNIVLACDDIRVLNPTGYQFIYLCGGFIAHFNRGGFIDHYTGNSLKDDIIRFKALNQWDNFHPGEEHYEYYMSKKEVYNKIIARISVDKPERVRYTTSEVETHATFI